MSVQPARRSLVLSSALAVAAGVTAGLTACASNSFAPPVVASSGLSLKSARLQVYSFLDLRDAEFGPNMLLEFDKQLVKALAAEGVTAGLLRFKESEQGKYFSTGNSDSSVPVRQVVEGNASAERSLGAKYRLIVFPSRMLLAGAWKHYEIRWEIIDIETSKRLWATVSNGKHANAWKNDEDPQPRAKTIVDGLIAGLKSSKVL